MAFPVVGYEDTFELPLQDGQNTRRKGNYLYQDLWTYVMKFLPIARKDRFLNIAGLREGQILGGTGHMVYGILSKAIHFDRTGKLYEDLLKKEKTTLVIIDRTNVLRSNVMAGIIAALADLASNETHFC